MPSCLACVVTCADYRLHRRGRVSDLVGRISRLAGGPCDVITRRGGIQDLLRGDPGFAESVFRDLEVCVRLHGVRTIYLMNHANCAAYRPFAFASAVDERLQHEQDLRQAAVILGRRFESVHVVPMFAALRDPEGEEFILHEVPERVGSLAEPSAAP